MNPLASDLIAALSRVPLEPRLIERAGNWLTSWDVPTELCKEVGALIEAGNWTALTDAFFQDLAFGTGGLRGVVGAGTNRMNAVAVQRVAQGLANFIVKEFAPDERRVVIAFDSRLWSKPFAMLCAEVLAAAQIPTFVFEEPETTPALSFAVRSLKCCVGLCLTASHNPPEYAGLKVYAPDGAQVVPPLDGKILAAVNSVTKGSEVRTMSIADARASHLFNPVPPSVSESYFAAVKTLETLGKVPRKIRVAFTPLHGTGAKPARRVMKDWGFDSFAVVPEQEHPDGNFPTVRKPNPEEPSALKLLVDFAQKEGAEVGFATDPDSDRLALVSRESSAMRDVFADQVLKDYVLLNGNQTGSLLLSFLLPEWRRAGRLPEGASVVKTIVTSELQKLICNENGVQIFNTLTGFKWIAALVREWELTGAPYRYVFGTEESFGYMPGAYVRDKDGIAALAMAAEMVDAFRQRGQSPCEALLDLFSRHGAWREDLDTIDLEGKAGQERTAAIMKSLRVRPPEQLAGTPISAIEDYLSNTLRHRSPSAGTGFTDPSTLGSLPSSDVIILRMKDGTQISVRPSGTEPKIKFYYSTVVRNQADPVAAYRSACESIQSYRNAVQKLVASIE